MSRTSTLLATTGLAVVTAGALLLGAAAQPPRTPPRQGPPPQAAPPPAPKPFTGTPTTAAGKKKIVFLAGPKDHGRIDNGRHEYEKDLRALAGYLETSPNLKNIETKVYVGKAPQDLTDLQDAAAIVIEASSDRDANETHPLFPQEPATDRRTYDPATTAWLERFNAVLAQGTGIAIFHYSTWVEHWVARKYYLQWIGALWVMTGSTNPVAEWTMNLENPTHPIQRGVKPWTYRDEVFCRYYLPTDARRTDLLIGSPQKAERGPDVSRLGPQVAAWAYNRDDGGRGFVMGGVDFHDNLSAVEDYRRFLLNGIVWIAGVDVPAGGVQSVAAPSAP